MKIHSDAEEDRVKELDDRPGQEVSFDSLRPFPSCFLKCVPRYLQEEKDQSGKKEAERAMHGSVNLAGLLLNTSQNKPKAYNSSSSAFFLFLLPLFLFSSSLRAPKSSAFLPQSEQKEQGESETPLVFFVFLFLLCLLLGLSRRPRNEERSGLCVVLTVGFSLSFGQERTSLQYAGREGRQREKRKRRRRRRDSSFSSFFLAWRMC